MKTLLVFAVLCPAAGYAADTNHPLDVKPGLWESTTTSEISGTPPIPVELLAKMTPEQRARMEAASKARAAQSNKAPQVRQSCLTKESLARAMNFGNEGNKSCERTVVRSTSTMQDIRFECVNSGMKTAGSIHVEAVDSEHVKGTSQVDASGGNNTANVKIAFSARWLGSDCSAMKK